MRCPKCSKEMGVETTKRAEGGFVQIRYRKCGSCAYTIKTEERTDPSYRPHVARPVQNS